MESAILVGSALGKHFNLFPCYVFQKNKVDQVFFEILSDEYLYKDDIYVGQVINSYKTYYTIDIGRSVPALLKRTDTLALNDGAYVPIQITRTELPDAGSFQGIKGAKSVSYLSIAGTFLGIHIQPEPIINPKEKIDLPNSIRLLLSKHHIPMERIFFRSNMKKLLSSNENWEHLLTFDLDQLAKQYQEILSKVDLRNVRKIYQGPSPLQRYIRDLPANYSQDIYTQDDSFFHNIKSWLVKHRPDLIPFLKYVNSRKQNYNRDLSFFDEDEFLDSLRSPIIPLSQGNMVVETTSVATTVDINSHHHDPLVVNRLAANALIDNIKWRQLGGRLIIDFIKPDYINYEKWIIEQKVLEKIIKTGLSQTQHKLEIQKIYWSKLGWLEILLPYRTNQEQFLK